MKKTLWIAACLCAFSLTGCLTEDSDTGSTADLSSSSNQGEAKTFTETREIIAFGEDGMYTTRELDRSCSDGQLQIDTLVEDNYYKIAGGKFLQWDMDDEEDCVAAATGTSTTAIGTWKIQAPFEGRSRTTGEACTLKNDAEMMGIQSGQIEIAEKLEKVTMTMDMSKVCFADGVVASHDPSEGPAPKKIDCNTVEMDMGGATMIMKVEFPKNDIRAPKVTYTKGSKACVMQVPLQEEVTEAYCADSKRTEEMMCLMGLFFGEGENVQQQ
jgi:hypothetical protein